jgi:hypothetical protein
MSSSNYVTVLIEKIKKETDKAFLCEIEDGEDVWLPFTHVADYENYEEGDEDLEISITEWMAREKGLI